VEFDRETIRQNIKISAKDSLGYYQLMKHNTWFDEQTELSWQQDPSEINGII
jgi:hypothetical protein